MSYYTPERVKKLSQMVYMGDGMTLAERLEASRLIASSADLLAACEAALAHTDELRDAWMRGCLSEHDGLGGIRSNRNVDVNVKLRAAINKAKP